MICLLLPLFLASCLSTHIDDEKQFYRLATGISKLSKAVEAVVAFDSPPIETTGPELLVLATEHDPSLLAPFSEYSLHVFRQGDHATVLVCTSDGRYALLEDAGCSAALDRHAWKYKPLAQCRPAIDLERVCSN